MRADPHGKVKAGMLRSDSAPLIICFGDSLTAGFQAPSPDNPAGLETPYGGFLQERLGTAARVAVSGLCGELTGEMTMRFRRDVLDHRPAVVVILGGTNDLGWNAQPTEIMRNLMKMYESALAAGVEPIPVTVPSLRLDGDFSTGEGRRWLGEHIARRQVLNRLIGDYAASKHLHVVDVFTATAEPETWLLAERYSNDGLHLTTDGYRLLATLLYDQVLAARFGRP
jgi:lysophospholipase L1-like esterase